MSNIFWNSSSINSFFGTSLNSSNSMSSLYSAFSDSAMIKSGSYKKLMKSYFDTVDDSSSSKSSSSSSSTSSSSSSKSRHACTYTYDSQKKTVSTIKNKVLEELLSDEPRKSTITNPVLDELLSKNKEKNEAADGTVTDKTESSTDTATEAAAGSVIDESV